MIAVGVGGTYNNSLMVFFTFREEPEGAQNVYESYRSECRAWQKKRALSKNTI